MGLFTVLPRLALAAAMAAGGGKHPAAALPGPAALPDTGAMVAHPLPAATALSDPDDAKVTAAMVDAGRGIFHGQGGCFACHGASLQGSAVAPPLDKHGKPWLAAKGGSFAAILQVVTHGVPGTIMVAHPNGISDA